MARVGVDVALAVVLHKTAKRLQTEIRGGGPGGPGGSGGGGSGGELVPAAAGAGGAGRPGAAPRYRVLADGTIVALGATAAGVSLHRREGEDGQVSGGEARSAADAPPDPATGRGAVVGRSEESAVGRGEAAAEEAGAPRSGLAAGELGDEALEALLTRTPNWERVEDLVGRRLPEAGTPEFQTVKKDLEAAGYQLDVLTEGGQPFRLRRTGDKAEAAPLTVTPEGVIALKTEGGSRISVPSRYKRNHLHRIAQAQGQAAMEKAKARLQDGFQVHHLIPDKVAQGHKLIQEVLRRLKDYTIDRGSNLIDMPSSLEQSQGGIVHRGSHPEYDRFVLQELDKAIDRLTDSGKRNLRDIEPKLLDDALRKIEDKLRKAIDTGDLPPAVLKELRKEGMPAGRKLGLNAGLQEVPA